MKTGDKIRFLDDVGGGTVVAFQGKDVVVVRDENGFDIPVLARECVVVEPDRYGKVLPAGPASAASRGPESAAAASSRSVSGGTGSPAAQEFVAGPEDIAGKPLSFKPRPLQRRGGERLNVHIGFVKRDAAAGTETVYEAYLINDSNYCFRFGLYARENGTCTLLHEDLAEPNTKMFLREVARQDLPTWERVTLQGYAFKESLPFLPKPVACAAVRMEGARFFRPGAFKEGVFFNEPALLFDVVRDDKVAGEVPVSAMQLQDALLPKDRETARRPGAPAPRKEDPRALLEVDLHASELLETTAGMQARDILEYQLDVFRRTMNEHLKEKGRKIVFIHGKGDGVLRRALLKELRRAYKSCTCQDASFREYGFGATMVTIR